MRNEALLEQTKSGINWVTTTIVVTFHIGALASLFFFSWQAVAATLFLWWVSGSLGIGMGFHRLLTHRGFQTPKWVEYFLTICGTLTLQGGPINWVATHRIHHAYADAEGDPHTPRDGKWWAHIGWIMFGTGQQFSTPTLARFAPDLMRDKFHVWLNRFYWLPITLLGVVLFALGGWSLMLWGVFLRTVGGWHITWFVNSVTHVWGTRRFESRDDSTNNWWVAVLSFGEGWHNNHHAHPTSARHGLRWYEIDMNWYGIRTLQFLGLAKNIKVVTATQPVRPASDKESPDALSQAA
ncbi:MAG TPA: fatty acid desaturase [Pyrinomonadaceae bacterium]|jgi:stearoyl-CoA desaturase (delta-9 desaturase)